MNQKMNSNFRRINQMALDQQIQRVKFRIARKHLMKVPGIQQYQLTNSKEQIDVLREKQITVHLAIKRSTEVWHGNFFHPRVTHFKPIDKY